jgi:hypothetical protein
VEEGSSVEARTTRLLLLTNEVQSSKGREPLRSSVSHGVVNGYRKKEGFALKEKNARAPFPRPRRLAIKAGARAHSTDTGTFLSPLRRGTMAHKSYAKLMRVSVIM